MNPKRIPKLCSGMLLPARLFPRNTFAFSTADAERLQSRGCGERARAGSSLPQQARHSWTLGAGQGQEEWRQGQLLRTHSHLPVWQFSLSWHYEYEGVHLFMYCHSKANFSAPSQKPEGPKNEWIQVTHSCLS